MQFFVDELNNGHVRQQRLKVTKSKLRVWWKNEKAREKRMNTKEKTVSASQGAPSTTTSKGKILKEKEPKSYTGFHGDGNHSNNPKHHLKRKEFSKEDVHHTSTVIKHAGDDLEDVLNEGHLHGDEKLSLVHNYPMLTTPLEISLHSPPNIGSQSPVFAGCQGDDGCHGNMTHAEGSGIGQEGVGTDPLTTNTWVSRSRVKKHLKNPFKKNIGRFCATYKSSLPGAQVD